MVNILVIKIPNTGHRNAIKKRTPVIKSSKCLQMIAAASVNAHYRELDSCLHKSSEL